VIVVCAMVNLHGLSHVNIRRFAAAGRAVPRQRLHEAAERPPDPQTLLTPFQLESKISDLVDWFEGKKNVLVITGAGLSTESGIPDYRGSNGSYHRGHKPMIHDQFISSASQRQRYWGRGLVGWKDFDSRKPNKGHMALSSMEMLGLIGVDFEDKQDFYAKGERENVKASYDYQKVSILTQNVDSLHQRAGSKHVTELHGRTDELKCMSCGARQSRHDFHNALKNLNSEWIEAALSERKDEDMRADGDAHTNADYSQLIVPSCQACGTGFLKPDVVFFGDTVPKHRVERCRAAVSAADGLLCVGTSLAVHSAFRFVKQADSTGTPIAILNVGETRAEAEGIDVLKVEAPIGDTLVGCMTAMEVLDPNKQASY